jgi:hypothetical protein
MEAYQFYPPQMKSTRVPYQVLTPGAANCHHELLKDGWHQRISVEAGVIFITFTCCHCGRQVCQSLDEISPPHGWNGARR